MSNLRMAIIATILATLATGCAMPELVRETPDGGRYVIHGSKSVAGKAGEEKAMQLIAQRCPAGFTIIEKGQVATSAVEVWGASTPLKDLYLDFKCN